MSDIADNTPTEPLVFTLDAFLATHGGMSRAKFYLLAPDERPRIMRVGRRVYVTAEAAADWRKMMERRTAQAEEAALAVADQQAGGCAA